MPALRPSPERRPALRPTARATRTLLLLLTVGALLAGSVSVLASGGTVVLDAGSALSARTVPGATTTQPSSSAAEAFGAAEPGTCLTWTEPDASDITDTPCDAEHLFEVAAAVDVSLFPGIRIGPGSPRPGTLRLAELRTRVCLPAVQGYLDGRFDPFGRYSVGIISPGEADWAAGGRTVRCGLQSVGVTGAPVPVTGTAAASDQSDVVTVGTCLGIDETLPTDPVDCALPHAAESVAVLDLAATFPSAAPSVEEQNAYLDPTCAAASDGLLGAPDSAAAKGLTVFWDTLAPESWAAGSRRVSCFVGQQLAGGGFAPVTGAAAGAVTVGTEPAPPAPAPVPDPALPDPGLSTAPVG